MILEGYLMNDEINDKRNGENLYIVEVGGDAFAENIARGLGRNLFSSYFSWILS